MVSVTKKIDWLVVRPKLRVCYCWMLCLQCFYVLLAEQRGGDPACKNLSTSCWMLTAPSMFAVRPVVNLVQVANPHTTYVITCSPAAKFHVAAQMQQWCRHCHRCTQLWVLCRQMIQLSVFLPQHLPQWCHLAHGALSRILHSAYTLHIIHHF